MCGVQSSTAVPPAFFFSSSFFFFFFTISFLVANVEAAFFRPAFAGETEKPAGAFHVVRLRRLL